MKRSFLIVLPVSVWTLFLLYNVARQLAYAVHTGQWLVLLAGLFNVVIWVLLLRRWLQDVKFVGAFVGVAFWLSCRGVYIPAWYADALSRHVDRLLTRAEEDEAAE